jgi:hypothetical protein
MGKVVIKNGLNGFEAVEKSSGSGIEIASDLKIVSTLTRKEKVTSINADQNLGEDDCGLVILGVVGTEQAAGTGFNLNLPAPKRGLYFKFFLAAPSIADNGNAAITVTCTSDGTTAADLAVGMVEGGGDDQGANVVSAVDILTFVHNKATAGDHAEFWCDGTNWFVIAKYDADGSVTLA